MKLRFEVPEAVTKGITIKSRVAIFQGATMMQYHELPAAYVESFPKCYKTAGSDDVYLHMGQDIGVIRLCIGQLYTLREIEMLVKAVEICGARLRIIRAYAMAKQKSSKVGRLFSIHI